MLLENLLGRNARDRPFTIWITMDNGLAISTVPTAAPPMMSSSAGCTSTIEVAVLHQISADDGAERPMTIPMIANISAAALGGFQSS